MEWPIAYLHYVPDSSLFIEMMRGAMRAMDCAAVKPGENVVISTDTNKLRIAEALAAAAYAVGAVPTIVMITPPGAHGAQPPDPVVGACARADVFFLPTTWSQTHTDARIEAIKNGARGATMCEVTEDALCIGGILADFEECDRVGRKLGAALSRATTMRLTTPAGTDIRGEVQGRPVQYETGLFREPGTFAALPNSEINISPIEGTAEGVVVADVRIMSVGVTRLEPVNIVVEGGRVTDLRGGVMAEVFKQTLASFKDDTAYNAAEFGLGLNPEAREYSTNLEDLGRLGHGHLGIGSNYAIGGSVLAPCHIDAIFKDVTVEFDGQVVWDKGKLLI
ncbi:MAG TPA: leucyl aminopeptidase [Anaerolineae bacterium]|nr:leucyl aminopeptidase [Anaerolineae bacterium]